MSETYNPIIRKEEFNGKRRLGSKRPRPNVSTALVFIKDGQIVEVIKEGDRANWGILRWGGYDSMYEVNLAPAQLSLKMTNLPSKNSSLKMFEAFVSFSCKADINNLNAIVKEKVTNVKEVLNSRFETILRSKSINYSIENRNIAEAEVCNYLIDEASDFADKKGLVISDVNLKLTLNDEAQKYLASLEKSKDALVQNTAEHSVNTQAFSHKSELELLEKEHEMRILEMDVKHYENILQTARLDALRLAQDPNSAEKIRQEQIESDIMGMRFKLEGFVSMAETGAIAAPELAEHAKRLLSSNLFNNTDASPNLLEATNDVSEDSISKSETQSEQDTNFNTSEGISRDEIENPQNEEED